MEKEELRYSLLSHPFSAYHQSKESRERKLIMSMEIKQNPCPFCGGNAAAMRDALLNIQEYAAAMDVDDGNVLAILDACRDALAAPARNCDKYDNFNDALRQFVKERPDTKKIDEQGRRVATAETYCVFASWLLAPAAERKGEGDGR